MNILEFIQATGQVATITGNTVTITEIVTADLYPISGTLTIPMSNGSKTLEFKWDVNGIIDPSISGSATAGHNLMAIAIEKTFRLVNKSELARCNSLADVASKLFLIGVSIPLPKS